ncbi:MAG: hypothetical protein AAFP00_10855, partial [Bacteroidota bacterium]
LIRQVVWRVNYLLQMWQCQTCVEQMSETLPGEQQQQQQQQERIAIRNLFRLSRDGTFGIVMSQKHKRYIRQWWILSCLRLPPSPCFRLSGEETKKKSR